ncbi:uncharacterized protein C6orf163 homolog [Tiliqua scincoides]|uniref:uncharacterized protein C6orf163 homolog n=1 Tax=Tiliqua scincoides TaxID=71010 RepID=UPI003463220D
MIRNPDFETFVCCAVCSKLIPPPPSADSFDRIREYRPFKTRYYAHRNILDIGADLKQQEEDRREAEVQKRIEKIQAKLWVQAEAEKKDAVEDALQRAEVIHQNDLEDLKMKDEQKLQAVVLSTRKEMLEHLEVELKRESEAAEQRMTHKLQRIIQELALEKATAIDDVREEAKAQMIEILTKQQKKHLEQLHQAGIIANEIYQKNLQQFAWEKKHEMEIAFSISQKEYEEETKKLLEKTEQIRAAQLEEVALRVDKKDSEIVTLSQQLENMTAWKDSLEAEILEIRTAFQKYINLTFPQLAPGQADFILPFRKASQFTDCGVEGFDQ